VALDCCQWPLGLGVNSAEATVLHKDRVDFFLKMKMVSRNDKFEWEVIKVYGLVQDERRNLI
jgi:hypothetical protein